MALKISLIIPSFNQGKYIEDALLSVLNQHDPSFELIIIDGASSDRSVEIIKKYHEHIYYWVSEKDSGQSDAINKGFKQATGDIITWLGSDDLLCEGAFARVRNEFETAPEKTGVIFGPSQLFRDGVDLHMEQGSRIQNVERRLAGMAFPQPSSFIRKKYLNLVGELNTDLHYGMDYDLFARLSMICNFKRADYCFSRYRIHDESKSGGDYNYFILDWLRIFSSIAQGLELKNTMTRMNSLKLSTNPLTASLEFFKRHKNSIKLDEELIAFFFFSNVFFHAYVTGKFSRARVLAFYLNENFLNKMKLRPEVNLTFNRSLNFSPYLLSAARTLKSLLSRI